MIWKRLSNDTLVVRALCCFKLFVWFTKYKITQTNSGSRISTSLRPMSPICSAEIPFNLIPGLGVGVGANLSREQRLERIKNYQPHNPRWWQSLLPPLDSGNITVVDMYTADGFPVHVHLQYEEFPERRSLIPHLDGFEPPNRNNGTSNIRKIGGAAANKRKSKISLRPVLPSG